MASESLAHQIVSEGAFLVGVCLISHPSIKAEDLTMTDSNFSPFLECRHGAHGVREWVGTYAKRDIDGHCEFLSTLVRLRPPSFPSMSPSRTDKFVLFFLS